MKAILYLIFGVVIIGAIAIAWPVSGYLIGAGIIYANVRDATTPARKAIKSMLRPLLVGLSILSIIALAVNLWYSPDADAAIRNYEYFVLRLNSDLAPWLRLDWWKFVGILAALTFVSYREPEWRLVSRAVSLKRTAGSTVKVLGVLASFTFFTDRGIVVPRADAARARVVATYARSKQEERRVVAQYLSVESTRLAITHASKTTINNLAATFRAVDNLGGASQRAKKDLAQYLADQPERPPVHAAGGEIDYRPLPAEVDRSAEELIARQLDRKAAIVGRETEVRKGLKKMISSTFGAESNSFFDVAVGFFEEFTAAHASEALPLAMELIVNVGQAYRDRWADPVIKRLAETSEARLSRWSVGGAHTKEIAAGVRELGIARPTRLAREATRDLSGVEAASGDEKEALLAKINKNANEADRLAKEFSPIFEGAGEGIARAGAASAATTPAALSANLSVVGAVEREALGAAASAREAAAAAAVAREAVAAAKAAAVAAGATEAVRGAEALKLLKFIRL